MKSFTSPALTSVLCRRGFNTVPSERPTGRYKIVPYIRNSGGGKLRPYIIAVVLLMGTLLARPAVALEANWVGAWPFGPAYSMAKSDTALFVAMGGGVAIYDVSRTRTPVRISEIRTPDLVRQIAYLPAGGSRTAATLCIAGQDSGFWIYDVGDPSNPVELGHQGTPEPDVGVAADGDLAAINLGKAGVWILNISRPNNPTLTGVLKVGAEVRAMALHGSNAYLATGSSGFVVADLSDPANPHFTFTTALEAPAEDVAVADHYAYVAAGSAGTYVYDVSLGSSPQQMAAIPATTAAHRVFVANNLLAVAEDSSVRVFDISHPAQPEEVSTYSGSDSGSPGGGASQVLLDGVFGYLLNRQTGVSVVDFSDSNRPLLVRTVPPAGSTSALAIEGDIAYLAGDFAGIRVLDVSTVTNPAEVKVLTLLHAPAGLAVANHLLFVPLYEDGLQIYDLTKPRAPRLLTLYQPQAAPGQALPRISAVFATDSHAYVVAEPAAESAKPSASQTSTLLTLDLLDPKAPVLTSSVEFEGRVVSSQAMAVFNDRLYVAAGIEGLHMFLLDDPAKPVEIGSYAAHAAVAVAAGGEYAYLAAGRDGFIVLDVRDPENIHQAGYLDTLDCRGKPVRCVGSARGLALDGNLVVLSNAEAGVRVAMISDPAHPRVIGPFPTADYATAVVASGSIAYIADRAGGLRILQFSE